MNQKRRYFGTDGIRGEANQDLITVELATRLGKAAGAYFRSGTPPHRVIIAKDTRLSGYMLEPALVAGFIAAGMDVILVGPLPTPAVAFLTRSLRCDLGVMISASHNPYKDNGIKLFGPDGYKLSDTAELEIEALMDGDMAKLRVSSEKLGRAKRLDSARGRYIECLKSTFSKSLTLDGLKVVIDCAHGAAYQIGPTILWELGAEVISVGIDPNGTNINDGCGSTYPEMLCDKVLEHGADIGIALDGDADRLIISDEKGQIVDGDQLMALIATHLHETGELKGDGIAATQMSNMGLELYLQTLGLKLYRTDVGDRYVIQAMREKALNLGGEQSGHIILSDFSTTGDGMLAALQVLAVLARKKKPMSQIANCFEAMPQLLKNMRYEQGTTNPLEREDVQASISAHQQALGNHGRIFVRPSGTEPLIRVMVEGEDRLEIEQIADEIIKVMGNRG